MISILEAIGIAILSGIFGVLVGVGLMAALAMASDCDEEDEANERRLHV